MAQQAPSHRSSAAVGATVFAAVVLMFAGFVQAIQGLVALFNDTFYVITRDYVFKFDVTTWGWIHLVVGVVVCVAGGALFWGAVWARTVGVVVASLSIITNILWMPYYPVWALLIIALDIYVIWALTAHGRDITTPA